MTAYDGGCVVTDGLYRATHPKGYCCGFVVRSGRVVRAAPLIGARIRGLRPTPALSALRHAGWRVGWVCP